MNRLEKRIFEEIDRFEKFSRYVTKEDAARIGAKIVLEVAEEAYERGKFIDGMDSTFTQFKLELEDSFLSSRSGDTPDQ